MENNPIASPEAQPQPNQMPVKKKTSPWVWILGGCFIIIILGFVTVAFLGWIGYRAAKDVIQEQAPNMEEFKGKMEDLNAEAEKWSQEAEKWSQEAERLEKEAQKMQDSLPSPQDKNTDKPMPY